MRWGSPTATTPFATLDFAHSLKSTSPRRSSIFGFYHPGGVFRPSATNNDQFDKLTDRSEGTPVPEPVEGALTKPFILTVAHASGSERGVLFSWQMLLLGLHSVSLLLSFPCFSV